MTINFTAEYCSKQLCCLGSRHWWCDPTMIQWLGFNCILLRQSHIKDGIYAFISGYTRAIKLNQKS